MSNTIDYSDYHIYKKEEIKERANSLEEELKTLERKEPELHKDSSYFRLKNLLQMEEFIQQELKK